MTESEVLLTAACMANKKNNKTQSAQSIYQFICLSIILTVCQLLFYHSVCLSFCSIILPFIYLSVSRSVCRPIVLYVCLLFYYSIILSVCPSFCLSVCLSVIL